jgi:hypothetical protein
MATCRSCGQSIVWMKTTRGKSMPVDARPTMPGTSWRTPWGSSTWPPKASGRRGGPGCPIGVRAPRRRSTGSHELRAL